MTEFREGQRVHVEFDGVVVYDHKSNDGLAEIQADGHNFSNSIHHDYITLADPENWPPQVGDIWESYGREYFITAGSSSEFVFCVDNGDDDMTHTDELKALNPKLVRRRGQ